MPVTVFSEREAIPERSTFQYRATFTEDDNETLILDAQVDQIYLTWTDTAGTIINSRQAVQVKGANGGTLASSVFTWQMTAEDTQAVGTKEYQARKLTLDIRLVGGGRRTHEATMYVRNLTAITS